MLAFPPSGLVSFPIVVDVHARSTSRNLPPLPQAIDLTPSIRLGLALHEIVIVGSAAGADKEGGAHERSGGGADLWDFWDVIGKRSGVDEEMLVESGQC